MAYFFPHSHEQLIEEGGSRHPPIGQVEADGDVAAEPEGSLEWLWKGPLPRFSLRKLERHFIEVNYSQSPFISSGLEWQVSLFLLQGKVVLEATENEEISIHCRS